MHLPTLCGVALALGPASAHSSKPNIIVIMSDDQDRLLNSPDYMPALQREIAAKGTSFTNHFGTTSNCCPGRATFLRGQQAHNTNITHVRTPGGNYDKFVVSGQDENYLPHFIQSAGYKAEYVGKFMNGYNPANSNMTPKGWDHIDALLDPFIYDYNKPVMVANGQRPVLHQGFHQTDVVRTKSLDRLDRLIESGSPFYLQISPFAAHVAKRPSDELHIAPTPCTRHNSSYLDIPVPRFDNWNPSDEVQSGKCVWIKDLPKLNSSIEESLDIFYQQRLQSLLGVDEIIEDVVAKLEEKGILENTFVVYTTDNGYHIGAHRLPAGKNFPYIMDSNLPLFVRGPGVPENYTSHIVSSHADFVPTFLDITGQAQEQWPPFLDGRSLLPEWQDPEGHLPSGLGSGPEVLNIEFWGNKTIEMPPRDYDGAVDTTNGTHKTVRIVSDRHSWVYARWCTGEMELYDTKADFWEVNNLARGVISPEIQRVIDRLNGILLAAKSCTEDSCRDVWSVLQPGGLEQCDRITSLEAAMDPIYDDFFANLPQVNFKECLQYQLESNEMPFYPEGAENGLGKAYRKPTDNFESAEYKATVEVPTNEKMEGGEEQRHVSIEEILSAARVLTNDELGWDAPY